MCKPLTDGYTPSGPLPAGLDVAVVSSMLRQRVQAKLDKRYDEADRIQHELVRMGVVCNDRLRTWSAPVQCSAEVEEEVPHGRSRQQVLHE